MTTALTGFPGEAGLDYGDALLIRLGDDGVSGPRVGMWARSGAISAELVDLPLVAGARQSLVDRGWEPFENARESLHKEVPADAVDELADEIVGVLMATMCSTAGLTLGVVVLSVQLRMAWAGPRPTGTDRAATSAPPGASAA